MLLRDPSQENLTQRDVRLVRESFAKLVERKDEFAHAFYLRLFETTPNIEHMFRGNRGEQERKLAAMLATAVGCLDRPSEFEPLIAALGRRHVGYGVRASDYATYEVALMWTLDRYLGADFTPETQRAWGAFFAYLSNTMQEAAAEMAGAHADAYA